VLLRSRPVRTILGWQLVVTAALALFAGLVWGVAAAVSAAAGGLVNVLASAVFFALASIGEARALDEMRRRTAILHSAGGVIRRALRAEIGKVIVIVVALWLAFTAYKGIAVVPFIAAFAVTALISGVGMFARDGDDVSDRRP
jgi:F0F1-type ATP synthase assembly protein I